ncbi:MAG: DUF3179 domain-containing (seleno)protein [Haloarculaceae archaeon]
MDRRRFLAVLGGGVAAGCSTLAGEDAASGASPRASPAQFRSADTTASPTATPVGTVPLARHGVPQTICSEDVFDDPGIYAVTDPVFGSNWRDVEVPERYRGPVETSTSNATARPADGSANRGAEGSGLAPDQTVVGIAGDGRARAYPLSVLTRHEVVNDDVGAMVERAPGPVAVTYCPLCKSGLVAGRVVDDAAREFLVSGLLWRPPDVPAEAARERGDVYGAGETGGERTDVRVSGNLVMYDRGTRSYWSQLLARAICGPLAGTKLGVVPSGAVTWERWRREHPDTEVLLPPPHSGTHSP